MPACCVACCKSDTRNKTPGQKCPFFGVPKKQVLFDEWKKVIPAKRKGLSPKSLVCYLHFEDNCFRKDLVNWRLKAGSIPTLRLKREQTCVLERQSNLPVILTVPGGLIVLKQINTNDEVENEVLCFQKLKLPGESWQSRKLVNEQEHSVIVCFETVFVGLDPLVKKTAVINLKTKEIEYKVFQRKCPPINACLLQTFLSPADVERSLQYFDCVRTCPGITDKMFCELKEFCFPSGSFENGTWRSKMCLQLITQVKQDTENDILKHPCSKCNKMRTTILLPRLERKQQNPPTLVKNEYLSREALLMKLHEIEKQIKTIEATSRPHEEHEMVMADFIEVNMF